MKTLLLSLRFTLLLLAVIAIYFPASAWNKTVTVDEIRYTIYVKGSHNDAVAQYAEVSGKSSDFSGHADIKPLITYEYKWSEYVNGEKVDYTLPLTAPVTSIYYHAFKDCTSLTSVTIPNSVTYIYKEAFKGCTNMISAIIGNSVDTIGQYAFLGCTNLTELTMGNSVKYIGPDAFSGCTSLASVNIPNSVSKIIDGAFSGCTSLSELTMGNSVKYIGSMAFSGCTSLKSVIIPNSLTSIATSVFKDCTSLTSVTIPNSVETIGNYAFKNCTSLTSVIIPNSVTTIKEYAFEHCSRLSELTIGKSVITMENSFYNSNSIRKLVWNAVHCEKIKGSTYSFYTNNIEKVTIGDEVEFIPSYFVENSKITEVSIPNSVTTIGREAFYNCMSLKTLFWNAKNCVIDNDSFYYNNYPFYNCSGLAHIVVGSMVESIGNNMFCIAGINNIDTVTCYAMVPPAITASCFERITYDNAQLVVPEGTEDAYKKAPGWEEFNKDHISTITIIPGVDDQLLGDVNGDGMVDVLDVVVLVDYVLSKNPEPFVKENADLNEDGKIDVVDVIVLIDRVLNGS